jgi:hypothetical protein
MMPYPETRAFPNMSLSALLLFLQASGIDAAVFLLLNTGQLQIQFNEVLVGERWEFFIPIFAHEVNHQGDGLFSATGAQEFQARLQRLRETAQRNGTIIESDQGPKVTLCDITPLSQREERHATERLTPQAVGDNQQAGVPEEEIATYIQDRVLADMLPDSPDLAGVQTVLKQLLVTQLIPLVQSCSKDPQTGLPQTAALGIYATPNGDSVFPGSPSVTSPSYERTFTDFDPPADGYETYGNAYLTDVLNQINVNGAPLPATVLNPATQEQVQVFGRELLDWLDQNGQGKVTAPQWVNIGLILKLVTKPVATHTVAHGNGPVILALDMPKLRPTPWGGRHVPNARLLALESASVMLLIGDGSTHF